MQDSNTASARCADGIANWELVIDRTTTMWVSSTMPLPPHPSPFFIIPRLPCMIPYCESVCDRRSHANPFFFSPDTDVRLRTVLLTPLMFRAPALHLELLRNPSLKARFHFYPIHSSSSPATCLFKHIPQLQCFYRRSFESCVT